jgi:hypothetical protein
MNSFDLGLVRVVVEGDLTPILVTTGHHHVGGLLAEVSSVSLATLLACDGGPLLAERAYGAGVVRQEAGVQPTPSTAVLVVAVGFLIPSR